MIQKPKIQYVGQFYVHGSEARALELEQQKKQAQNQRPQAKPAAVREICVDPVALAGILVAVVMLVVMVLGAIQLHKDWVVYEQVAQKVDGLMQTNVELTRTYRAGYDLEEIETKALAMGLIPKSEIKPIRITVTPPEAEPVLTLDQKIVRFWHELWA